MNSILITKREGEDAELFLKDLLLMDALEQAQTEAQEQLGEMDADHTCFLTSCITCPGLLVGTVMQVKRGCGRLLTVYSAPFVSEEDETLGILLITPLIEMMKQYVGERAVKQTSLKLPNPNPHSETKNPEPRTKNALS